LGVAGIMRGKVAVGMGIKRRRPRSGRHHRIKRLR